MDVIVGEATEDTEILDARVDALSQTHSNLGANIRNIHSEVLSNRAQIAGLKANDELHEAELTAQVDRDIKLSEHGEFLQEQIDQNAEGVLNVGAMLSEEVQHSKEQDDALFILGEYIAAEAKTRGELRDDFTHEVESSNVRYEHLQEQSDDNAQAVIQTASAVQKLNADLGHEARVRAVSDEHLQEQSDDNAQAILNITTALHNGSYLEGAIAGQKSPVDWSKAESLAIPEPRCAVVNFTGLASMPTSKTVDIPAVIEFWDMQGNYFKKNIVCSAQGGTSLSYVKKNVKFDLLNDDGSEFDLKIGNWVAQDGFHLKAYYTDFFRGVGAVSYKFWDEVMRFNGLDKDRPYKLAMIDASKIFTSGTIMNNPDDITLQMDTGALCHPDGFPCIVYLNGEFYGVFAWQIKKQRKNYRMDKSTVEHIHLDGTLYTQYFWDGVINWTMFEIRNPNKLYTMNGKKYDGDSPKELIDETSEKYDPDNKDHVRSAKVKKYIQDFVRRFGELKRAPTREKYDELFDWENQRDYMIFSDVIKNNDGFGKNWQWTTYDGVKWYVNAYDLDMSFGGMFNGTQITAPLIGHINTNTNLPAYYVVRFYNTELEARYKELRDAGIISVSNILDKLVDWTSRIGTDNYELEYERWPDSPCIVNYTDSLYRVKKWLETEIANMDRVYHYEPLTLADIQKNHDADVESLKSSTYEATASLSRLRQIYDEGLKEQVDTLADLMLRKIFTAKEERERLELRFSLIEEALEENGISIPSASIMTDTEVNNMIDNVLNGSDKSGATPQNEDDAEIYNMLDDVFNGTDTGSYEDEVTKDLDPIFNP